MSRSSSMPRPSSPSSKEWAEGQGRGRKPEDEEGQKNNEQPESAKKWSPPKGSLVSYLCCCSGQTTTEVSAVATDVTGDNAKDLNDPKNKTKKCEKVEIYKLSKKEKKILKMASFSQKSSDPIKRGAAVAVKENGGSCPVKFVWDYGGKEVHVCIMQNGSPQLTIPMTKAKEGKYLEAQAKLFPGRCEFRYAVDGYWKHDPELPALKNEHGHFNNMIKIKESTEELIVKNPNPENKPLISPVVSGSRQRCLSGDETLVLSGAEDVLSLNDTFVLSDDNNTFDDGNISDDDLLDQEILPDDDADQQAKGFKSFLMTEVNLDQDKRNTRRLDDDDVTQGKSSDVSQGTVKDVTRDTFNEVTKYTSSDVTQGTNTDKTQTTTINTITQDSDVTKESTNDVTLEKSSDVTKDTISDVTHRLESGVLETDFDEDFHSAVGESPEVSDQDEAKDNQNDVVAEKQSLQVDDETASTRAGAEIIREQVGEKINEAKTENLLPSDQNSQCLNTDLESENLLKSDKNDSTGAKSDSSKEIQEMGIKFDAKSNSESSNAQNLKDVNKSDVTESKSDLHVNSVPSVIEDSKLNEEVQSSEVKSSTTATVETKEDKSKQQSQLQQLQQQDVQQQQLQQQQQENDDQNEYIDQLPDLETVSNENSFGARQVFTQNIPDKSVTDDSNTVVESAAQKMISKEKELDETARREEIQSAQIETRSESGNEKVDKSEGENLESPAKGEEEQHTTPIPEIVLTFNQEPAENCSPNIPEIVFTLTHDVEDQFGLEKGSKDDVTGDNEVINGSEKDRSQNVEVCHDEADFAKSDDSFVKVFCRSIDLTSYDDDVINQASSDDVITALSLAKPILVEEANLTSKVTTEKSVETKTVAPENESFEENPISSTVTEPSETTIESSGNETLAKSDVHISNVINEGEMAQVTVPNEITESSDATLQENKLKATISDVSEDLKAGSTNAFIQEITEDLIEKDRAPGSGSSPSEHQTESVDAVIDSKQSSHPENQATPDDHSNHSQLSDQLSGIKDEVADETEALQSQTSQSNHQNIELENVDSQIINDVKSDLTTETKLPDELDQTAHLQSDIQTITFENKLTDETATLQSQLSDTSSEHLKTELENVEAQIIIEVKSDQTSEPGAMGKLDHSMHSDNQQNISKDEISDEKVDTESFIKSEKSVELTQTEVVETNKIEKVEQLISENEVADLIDFGETENGKCLDEETGLDSIHNKDMGQVVGKNGTNKSEAKTLKSEKANNLQSIDEAVTGHTSEIGVDKSTFDVDKLSATSNVEKPLSADETESVVDKSSSETSNKSTNPELIISNRYPDSGNNKEGIQESQKDTLKVSEEGGVDKKSDELNEVVQNVETESNNLSEKIATSQIASNSTLASTNCAKSAISEEDQFSFETDTNGHHNTTSSDIDAKSLSGRSENSESESVTKSDTSGDVFKEVNKELTSIKKSRSRSDILVHQKLEKSASRSKFLEDAKQKRKEVEEEKMKTALMEAEEKKTRELEERKRKEAEREREEEEERRRKEARENSLKSSFDDQPKKMDEIFAPIRETSVYINPDFDPNHREIKGMSEDVRLKKASVVKPNQTKKEEEPKKKKNEMYSLPAKPATFQKPKPKPVEEEPPAPTPPEPVVVAPEVVKLPTPQPEARIPTPEPVQAPVPAPKSPTPPRMPSPTPPAPEEEVRIASPRVSLSPAKFLPPKVGINGFNNVGRLVLRAALESGMDVVAVNDPFIPAQYMVYMLKFDIAHSHAVYHKKEMNVRESPTGQIIINGRVIHVFDEADVSKIPWELAGVNYVVETSEALNNLADAKLHLRTSQKGLRMRHVLEEEERRKMEPDLVPSVDRSKRSNTRDSADPYALLTAGCRKVVVASPSPDAPLYSVGVNDSKMDHNQAVTSHVSAPVAALTPVLSILQKEFGIRSCAYTLLKSIRGRGKEIKCQNLGPTSHSRSVKWDFTENLIPTTSPSLEEETLRILPGLRGKLHGMCVYVPTPEVSMFDLTIQLEKESDTIYRDVCLKIKEAASEPPLQSVLRYCMKMSEENSASSVFVSEPHSSIVDGKSGCQVSKDTVKLVVWFDNEFGFASRVVDLIAQAHVAYCQT